MAQLTTEEGIFIVKKNVEQRSVIGAQRVFRRQSPRHNTPTSKTMLHTISKWRETGSVKN